MHNWLRFAVNHFLSNSFFCYKMNKLKLIIQHEYMTMVGKKSFIIMTLLIPFLILIVGCIPVLLAYINSSADTSVTRIAVIDESGNYGSAFKDTPNYRFMVMQGDKAVNAHEFYKNAGESIDAVMVIPANVLDDQQVMGHEEIGEAEFLLQFLEGVENLRLDGDVEGRYRLVAHDELRRGGEGSGDADALTLATRERVDVTRSVLFA